jgi:hypothetical protein
LPWYQIRYRRDCAETSGKACDIHANVRARQCFSS